MALKADSSQSALQILVDGITSPVTADAQVVELATIIAGVATVISAANPLPTTDTVTSMPATSDTTDTMSAALQVGKLKSGITDITPGYKFLNLAASQTDTVIQAATTSKKVLVVSLVVIAGATPSTTVFNSKPAGAGVAVTPTYTWAANGGIVLPFNPAGWFVSAVGEGLTVSSGAGSTTEIQVTYAVI